MSKTVRLNSEIKINHDLFTLKLGTTNKVNPQVIYIEGRTFISPLEEKETYEKDIRDFKTIIQRKLNELLRDNEYFYKNYILDFQIANSGVRVGKKSFLSFEFLLKQRKKDFLKLKDIKNLCLDFFLEVISSLETSIREHNFNISKTKNVIIENAVLLHK